MKRVLITVAAVVAFCALFAAPANATGGDDVQYCTAPVPEAPEPSAAVAYVPPVEECTPIPAPTSTDPTCADLLGGLITIPDTDKGVLYFVGGEGPVEPGDHAVPAGVYQVEAYVFGPPAGVIDATFELTVVMPDCTGPTGPPGEPGAPGDDGSDGVDGTDGASGVVNVATPTPARPVVTAPSFTG